MDRARVLIVDDEPRNLSLLEALLANVDATIVRATGGQEAIDLFKAELEHGGFLLVLLDVMMPEVDGLTALAAMRAATPPGQRIPIVLVTALSARDDRIRGLEAGADDFLTKPLDPTEVRCRARTFLALSTAQRTLADHVKELERLHRDRTELSRMLVHDLKNPLAALDSNLTWIAGRVGANDARVAEAIEDSRGSSSRLLALIGGLVEVDRAENGQLVLDRKPTSISAALNAVARRHRRDAEFNGIGISVEADVSLEAIVDDGLVTRAVENLVENATRYAGRNGRIALVAAKDGSTLELSVCNTGAPIAADVRATIFEKFVTSERRGHHQGLGLYLCRLVAEAHGGQIDLLSDEEWPTRFVMRVPLAPPRPRRGPFASDEDQMASA